MDVPPAPGGPSPFRRGADLLEGLDETRTARILAAAGDVTLVVDRAGIIRDLAVGGLDLDATAFADWIDRPWVDTVAIDSRSKVEEMLRDAFGPAEPRWRQVNQEATSGQIPLRYMALEGGHDGGVIAVGRDMRPAAALQQRLLAAQQSMERDYRRLREAERRYRLLFDLASDAILILDAATRRVTDANPAAEALFAAPSRGLDGQPFAALFHADDRDDALAFLGALDSRDRIEPVSLRRAHDGAMRRLEASQFRHDRTRHLLVRILPEGSAPAGNASPSLPLFDRMPDGLVLTDRAFTIILANPAFLDLADETRPDGVVGQPLDRYLGRPGIDLPVLVADLRQHAVVRNAETIVRGRLRTEEVEVSAVALGGEAGADYAFAIRSIARRLDRGPAGPAEPRSVAELTELVGRVPLKDIVRESTDLIERLCIEAALDFTQNNRASAAEILGLSRQSLYSKLRRFGMGNAPDEGPE
jgi:transcriptional regulator PpsR